jgi:site-specific recombinase XerD
MTTLPARFHETMTQFLADLSGKNRSSLTIRCYRIDVSQFLTWIQENDLTVSHPAAITKSHLSKYLSSLSDQGLSGRTRARKLAAIKEYFRFLVGSGVIAVSPTESVSAPKRERNGRNYLTPEEYTRLLSLAGSNPRDYAILQVFLQTGIWVSELCSLTLSDVDLADRALTIRQGKGMADRSIELEKKGYQAMQSAASRPTSCSSGWGIETSTQRRFTCILASRTLDVSWSSRAYEKSISLEQILQDPQTRTGQAG